MSRGSEFLLFVTEKLKEKIREMDAQIREVEEDIAEMNAYYWENYTEMDQYGYENFDNQQALLTQVNANQENKKKRHRLKKLIDSPFFGSVDFLYSDEDEAESFYIGIGNFATERGQVPLIYDWRAPVSGLFYDYDSGPASYEAPGGVMEGEICSKWQYKVRGGCMIYEFESDMKIDDDILKQELGGNGDTKLKNIVRTIQKEQNAIIRNTKDQILVIQGAAGSGKTSIALHRIAYLLYHDRNRLNSSNVLILSPNGVFADYISHILPELGEEHIREMSFDLFAYRELQGIVYDCEDRYHQIERQMKGNGDSNRFRLKQSKVFVQEVEGFLIELEDRLVEFRDITFRGITKRAGEILEMFYYKFQDIPLLTRMNTIRDYFIDECETLYDKDLSEDERDFVNEKFASLYVTTDLYEIYNWFLKEQGFPVLPDLPPEKRNLEYEDVYPMLYLKYRLMAGKTHKHIRHLVIDEMQDYSYLQYVILERIFSCNMTILGDRAQTVDEKWQDVTKFLPDIFGKQVRSIEIKKSYRNTIEIADYAKRMAQVQGIDYMERHGKAVEEYRCLSWTEARKRILGQIASAGGAYETAAVLAMTEDEAKRIYTYLKKHLDGVNYIDRDSSSFRKGVTVTTFYMAKGLEFDQVYILGGERSNPFFSQFRYICATRALHELYVYDVEEEMDR